MSLYPKAVDVARVGTYSPLAGAGGGFVFDEVLEYRVWFKQNGESTYRAFATFEEAEAFSTLDLPRIEPPLALVLQREHVNEPEPGKRNRVKLALKLVAKHAGSQILVFHEDIDACEVIHEVLRENGVPSGVYHSRMPLRERAVVLLRYRRSEIRVLVTCRALDEGFNVPETEVGIIAASTATRRQRIQRLGRILRPAKGKSTAIIYSLVASGPEISRLKAEESDLEGVAEVSWSRA